MSHPNVGSQVVWDPRWEETAKLCHPEIGDGPFTVAAVRRVSTCNCSLAKSDHPDTQDIDMHDPDCALLTGERNLRLLTIETSIGRLEFGENYFLPALQSCPA